MRSKSWLNRFAWFTAVATLFLICSGGMVTSKGAGLAVPDWPTTFGYNMFLFPVSQWVGGILFEHTHRLIASTVGFLTIILAIWLWRVEDRQWVRTLGLLALGGIILQGILGGLRVTMLQDQIGIFHACLAQAFLGLLVFIALVTSRFWRSLSSATVAGNKLRALRTVALLTTAAIYIQLGLGAMMRHQHRDLAILDLNMPRLNGRQCLEEIRKIDFLDAIPVVIYSTSFGQRFVVCVGEVIFACLGKRARRIVLSVFRPHPVPFDFLPR